MTNYYEELQLDPKMSAKELIEELIRLEVVWHKREIARPEEAAAKQVLITNAKKVFASEASKADYDRELYAKPKEEKPEDPDAERKRQYQYWFNQANSYFQDKAYDLAKTAIEKAMNFASSDREDPIFYSLASSIYRENKDASSAMSYINRAIVLKNNVAWFHMQKAMICELQYNNAVQNRFGDTGPIVRQLREELKQTDILADQEGDGELRGKALGALAVSLYNTPPTDQALAEEIAKVAVDYGDKWGGGSKVLQAIEKKRQDAIQAEIDKRRREEEAKQRAEKERLAREQAEKEWREKRKRERLLNVLSLLLIVLSLAGMVLSLLLVMASSGDIRFLPRLPLWLIVVFAAVCVGTLNYCDMYRSYEIDTWVRVVGFGWGAGVVADVAAVRGAAGAASRAVWTAAGITAAVLLGAALLGRLIYTIQRKRK